MATEKFIPTVWSAKILDALEKSLVYAQLFNRDYEGEITDAGDTVKIGTIGDVTIKDYTRSSDIAAADEVAPAVQTLTIDQAKYFNIAVDDVDAAQSNLSLLDTATARAGYGFSDVADQYLGGLLASKGTLTAGLGSKTSPLVITKDNAYETLVNMKTALDKAKLPKQGRVCVMPSEFEGFMLLDPRFVQVSADEAQKRLTEGSVYRAAGFDIMTSVNAPSPANGAFNVVASSPICGTFAEQILKTEAYRPEKRFSDAVKGLHVYGAAVTRPECVAVATVKFTA
jgi:N4-gp56 family major capsid protein